MKYIIILGASFVIEGILSLLFSFINPLLSLVALIYLILYSKMNRIDIIKISAVAGFIYDSLYMHTFLINMLLFVLLAYFLTGMNNDNRWQNSLIICSLFILLYILFSYFFVLVTFKNSFEFWLLIKSIIIAQLNIIYFGLLLLIFNRSSKRRISIYYYR